MDNSDFPGYTIEKMEADGETIFRYNNLNKTVKLNFLDFAPGYRKVHQSHYYDVKNSTIVVMPYPTNLRLFVTNGDELYRRAKQWEYDQFESIHFPDSDNSKIYNHMIENLKSEKN